MYVLELTNERTNEMKRDNNHVDTSNNYNYGLVNLPENCKITKIRVNGDKTLQNVNQHDINLVSSHITVIQNMLIPRTDQSEIVIIDNKPNKTSSLTEYIVTILFSNDIHIPVEIISILERINPLRCSGGKSIIIGYDKKREKLCITLTIASTLNPIVMIQNVILSQHYTITHQCSTNDSDEMSSQNQHQEVSVNRKRIRKNDVASVDYKKISDATGGK